MNESIENINLSNSDVRTSKFNKKSLILILNYFISPILILIVFFNLLKNSTIMENLMSSGFVSIFFKNNKYLLENEELFNKFFTSVLSSFATFITFIIAVLLSKKRNDSISIKKSETSLKKLLLFGIGLGIFMILWNIIISYLYPLLGLTFKSKNTGSLFESLKFNKLLILNILIAAPLGEEIAFKYGIFTFFHEIFQDKGIFLKVILPAFVSAFTFAVIHDGLYLVPLYIVPSFIGCLIYKNTSSLLPCVLGHFLNNFLALIMTLYN